MSTSTQGENESREGIRHSLTELFNSQRLAMLSTHSRGQPYANLVAFACSSDLRFLYFATDRTTRKFNNLQDDVRMALLVTSSTNQESDFQEAVAVTVVGCAGEICGREKETALSLYLAKHPYLEDFARSPTCALMKVWVHNYILVKNFQHVMELSIEHETEPCRPRDR